MLPFTVHLFRPLSEDEMCFMYAYETTSHQKLIIITDAGGHYHLTVNSDGSTTESVP